MDTCINPCGLTILDTILSWTIPKLGANVDVTSAIEKLNIAPRGETLASFMVRCSDCDRAIRDAGVMINPNQLIRRMITVLNTCPQVVPYITSTIADFHYHVQQYPNKEYQYYPVTVMLQRLRTSGINMTMQITAPSNRYSTSRRSSDDRRSSTHTPTVPDGEIWRNKQKERLMNGDKRRLSFGTPSVATMNVDDDEDENVQNDQFFSETDQFIDQTEAYDTPNVNSFDSNKKAVLRL